LYAAEFSFNWELVKESLTGAFGPVTVEDF
jgi:hypothetical protein